ncbi:hypothetical protein L228DRAFT_75188 [Xylona heveae TC161]|uniref:Uncharacterized protein n=1 Tax=Xylona heveae (strain CBS 132557 / TC161) TaxID=1328760 RepID=A0A165ITI6_XYLHT|nr:hypothetical protein L228DRAFT_75188 [Xylona heveae TC161]KZF25368.1 hypothetical protein L228DRAFT_75188 [Xylona heveae TC161]
MGWNRSISSAYMIKQGPSNGLTLLFLHLIWHIPHIILFQHLNICKLLVDCGVLSLHFCFYLFCHGITYLFFFPFFFFPRPFPLISLSVLSLNSSSLQGPFLVFVSQM